MSRTPDPMASGVFTGNLKPVLHEIRHALARLSADDIATVIDLRSIPFAPGEESALEQRLGRGEARIEINALGPTEVVETGIGGVWITTHRNADDEVVGKFVEITRVPELVCTPAEDIKEALLAINRLLETP